MDEQTESSESAVSAGRRQFLQVAAGTGIACAVGTGSAQESPTEIADWDDLDAVRENRTTDYVLAADLDASTPGYDDHVGNPAGGWQPIGEEDDEFGGTLDGNGYEIRDLTVDRPEHDYVGLFGGISGTLRDITLVGVEMTGRSHVGGLVGDNDGQIADSSVDGDVTGTERVGGLVGMSPGNVRGSTASAGVVGERNVGGLVGWNDGDIAESAASGTVSGTERVGGLVGFNSYGGRADPGGDITDSEASGRVTGTSEVGGLVGMNHRTGVIDGSTATGDVSGDGWIGGLVGRNDGRLSNSHYDIEAVQINGEDQLTAGGLFPGQYRDWRERDRELTLEAYDSLTATDEAVEISDADGVRDALGFVQDPQIDWRLTADLDLTGDDAGLYFPYVRGEFDGNGHTVTLDIALPAVGRVGAIGHGSGTVTDLAVEGAVLGENQVGALLGASRGAEVVGSTASADTDGKSEVGGLVGDNDGGVTESTADGSVTGERRVGGLVGHNYGEITEASAEATVSGTDRVGGLVGQNSSELEASTATGDVTGDTGVGGLVGRNDGQLSNSHYDIEAVRINGEHRLTVGGLFPEQYRDWETNGREIPLEEYDSLTVDRNTVEISDPRGVRDALGFIHDRQLNWRLTADLDLTGDDAGLYFPYVRGEFDGDGHTVTLDIELPAVDQIGAIGYSDDAVTNLSVEGSVTGANRVGGLVGENEAGEITGSAASVDVTGRNEVGGLVGRNRWSQIENASASGEVAGEQEVGGLVGTSGGAITDSTASATVTGTERVGGIAGSNYDYIVRSVADGTVSGERAVGGLVGFNVEPIRNSTAYGTVTGTERVGGLVGVHVGGTVEKSIATASVSGDRAVGGLVGFNDRRQTGYTVGMVRESYWNTESTGQPTPLGDGVEIGGDVSGLGTEQMQGETAAEYMPALDFEEVWSNTTDPAGYPTPQTDSQDQTDSQEPTESDDGSGPGFGLGSALGSLGGVAYLLSRRRGDGHPNEQ